MSELACQQLFKSCSCTFCSPLQMMLIPSHEQQNLAACQLLSAALLMQGAAGDACYL